MSTQIHRILKTKTTNIHSGEFSSRLRGVYIGLRPFCSSFRDSSSQHLVCYSHHIPPGPDRMHVLQLDRLPRSPSLYVVIIDNRILPFVSRKLPAAYVICCCCWRARHGATTTQRSTQYALSVIVLHEPLMTLTQRQMM